MQKAAPGAELACRALNGTFLQDGTPVERGVMSYYATRALASAATMAEWLDAMERLAARDLATGRLAANLKPALVLLGLSDITAPGASPI
ncbi:MAG: hypothetical protein KDI55_08830 [Anaerolineae bacterium]|nr:hypothetical protein [Anaerolineae bacterium]